MAQRIGEGLELALALPGSGPDFAVGVGECLRATAGVVAALEHGAGFVGELDGVAAGVPLGLEGGVGDGDTAAVG